MWADSIYTIISNFQNLNEEKEISVNFLNSLQKPSIFQSNISMFNVINFWKAAGKALWHLDEYYAFSTADDWL